MYVHKVITMLGVIVSVQFIFREIRPKNLRFRRNYISLCHMHGFVFPTSVCSNQIIFYLQNKDSYRILASDVSTSNYTKGTRLYAR
jgi:hypothetical protein